MGIRILDRDLFILKQISKWRFMLSRQIKEIAFSGQSACDRRLRVLLDNGYIDRKKVLYGVPSLYTLTNQGRALIGLSSKQGRIRVEQILHDITVVDMAIYFAKNKGVKMDDIITEKQLHSKSGFGGGRHHPDFVFEVEGRTYCVECELTTKSKKRLEENIKRNFMEYDNQIWIIYKNGYKIREILQENTKKYPNIDLMILDELRGRDRINI